MKPRLITLLSALSLLLCIATTGAWIRAHSRFDDCYYTTSPYDNLVQHCVGFESGDGRIKLELDSIFTPTLLVSNGWGGFQEQFIVRWGWDRGTYPGASGDPWPLWGSTAYGPKSRLGFAGVFESDSHHSARSIWIPFYFLFVATPIAPCLWILRRSARGKRNRRRSKGLCLACGYDLRASTARCPECGTSAAPMEEVKAGRRMFPALASLLLLAGSCGIGVFWYRDSRERPVGVLTPDAICAALKPGMSEYEVNRLMNRPRFGEGATTPPEPTCSLLPDGSTLVCTYAKSGAAYSFRGDGTAKLVSFERRTFENLATLFPADLFPAVRAIHLAPPGVANAFDPVSLIRRANALQHLGKGQALAALRAYAKLAGGDFKVPFYYDLDARRTFLIARVLFDFPTGKPGAPAAGDEFPYTGTSVDATLWPRFPIVLQDDMPFCLDPNYEFDVNRGEFRDNSEIEAFLDRCERTGIMRQNALSPSGTPLQALETFARSGRWPMDNKALTLLRIQAIRAVSPLFITLKNEDWTCLQLSSYETSDAVWSHFLNDDRLKRMHWEAGEQRFVIPVR